MTRVAGSERRALLALARLEYAAGNGQAAASRLDELVKDNKNLQKYIGDAGTIPRIADRLVGSPDMYADEPREAEQSINFVTSHDGFTLHDLVSYRKKHNEANGENNRDGHGRNYSDNHGVEGPSEDPEIVELRRRQRRRTNQQRCQRG